MKAQGLFGSVLMGVGLWGTQAQAQAIERVAALDPALAAAPQTPSAESPAEASPATSPAGVEPPTTAAPAAAPSSTAPQVRAMPAPPPAAPPAVNGEPMGFAFSGRAKDAPAPAAATGPIRAQRQLELLAGGGWNNLGGWGVTLTYNAHPHLALDLAGGFSFTGWKAGLGARYNLLNGPFTPFVGGGFSMSTGLSDVRLSKEGRRDREDRDDFAFDPDREAKYDAKRSEFAQAVLGFEFIHRHGFTLRATAGYSWTLNKNNYTFITGKRDDDLARLAFGSGPVLAASFGYAFD